jgi:hypothetical protein
VSAIELARLRALAATSVADITSISRAAADIGREPVRAGANVVLGRHPDAPAAVDLGVELPTLANSASVALGICIGLAWHDRARHPYPGEEITFDDVTSAARALQIDVSATRHLVGAIRHVLADARLLDVRGDVIRLGPAIARWSEADLEAFRRNLDVLPAPRAVAR